MFKTKLQVLLYFKQLGDARSLLHIEILFKNGKEGCIILEYLYCRKTNNPKDAQTMTPREAIILARKKTGLSQTDFAFRSGVGKRNLQNWEQGQRMPNSADLFKCLDLVDNDILKIVEKMLK